jgi:hypothetical protein
LHKAPQQIFDHPGMGEEELVAVVVFHGS